MSKFNYLIQSTMEKLTTTKRIRLEAEVREMAIRIADDFGLAGVEFFCQQFPDIAKAYAQALKEENVNHFFQEDK